MDKKIILNERGIRPQDSGVIKGTRVIARVPGTDKILWVRQNKVLAAGSAYIANAHFDFIDDPTNPAPAPATPSYNQELRLYDPRPEVIEPTGPKKIYLFAIGTDGCAETGVQQFEVDYTKWLAPQDMVPFRYTNTPITDVNVHNRYGGQTTIKDYNGNDRTAYYFKTFDAPPKWIQRYIGNQTASISNMYNNNITDPMESYVELKLSVTSTEAREWFKYKFNSSNPYVNTISLVQGWYVMVGGMKYYKDLHPVTKLNFPTESLREGTKGLDITYHIFY